MRYSASEKFEIIELVEQSSLSIPRTGDAYEPTFLFEAAFEEALEWHSRGQGFDSPWLHHLEN
jgi:hypothetical protein